MAMPAPFPSSANAVAMPVDKLAIHVLWYLADTGKYHRRVDFILERLRENHRPTPSDPSAYRQGANDLATPPARAWAEAWEWLITRGLVTANLADTSDHPDYWAISRRGRQVAGEADPLVHLAHRLGSMSICIRGSPARCARCSRKACMTSRRSRR
jgi:hypothetical protein